MPKKTRPLARFTARRICIEMTCGFARDNPEPLAIVRKSARKRESRGCCAERNLQEFFFFSKTRPRLFTAIANERDQRSPLSALLMDRPICVVTFRSLFQMRVVNTLCRKYYRINKCRVGGGKFSKFFLFTYVTLLKAKN